MLGRIHVSAFVMVACVVAAGCVTTDADGAKTQTAMSAISSSSSVGVADGVADGEEKSVKAGGVAEKPGKNESHVEVAGERVTVFVYIDTDAVDIPRRMLEPTAMLRTKGWLRKEFKVLPKQFNVPCRVLSRGFDDDDVIYMYITEYKLKDIKKLLARQEEN